MAVKMIVGLGNPGKSYVDTRHNVGYRILDLLEEQHFSGPVLVRPEGYMNTSGLSVGPIARRKGILPAEILVICDDFSIPMGLLRLRLKGSSGGHNGLDSILNVMATTEIPRLRVGIGPVPAGQDPADFVLGRFSGSEREKLQDSIGRAAEAVRLSVTDGFDVAMNRFNTNLPK